MHMEPKHIFFLCIQAGLFFLSIYFPSCVCQNSDEYATCVEPFQCGRLRNISYPFWGGNRPMSCGFPGFRLNCQGDNNDIPLLNILSVPYRVLEIDFSNHTLKVARKDLLLNNNTCPKVLYNTTLDADLFEMPSNDRNVTLYYNCTDQSRMSVFNQFNCQVNGATIINLFSTVGFDSTCTTNISVPINQTAARALQVPTAGSVNVLADVIASGFFIRWSADNDICEGCARSGGTCVYNANSGSTVCYKNGNGTTQVSNPIPYPAPTQSSGNGTLYTVLVSKPTVPITFRLRFLLQSWPGPAPAPTPLPHEQSADSPGFRLPKLNLSGSFGSSAGTLVGVIIGISILITILVIAVCYINRRRSRGGPNQVSNKDIEKFLLQHSSLASKRYKYAEIKKITKSFNDKLGQGGYGSVYKGMLPDGCLVAVKVLIETSSSGEEFINEVASISRTSHVNVVNLLGFCYDGNHRALIYEYMPNKSLDKFISTTDENCRLSMDKLYKIAVGVAKGLEYLHTGCNTRIVHFDIKPQNILLDDDFCPKISDFGLAKLCKKKQSVVSLLGMRGTVGYIAPEIFSRNFGRPSYKSDVYSYGMMVLGTVGGTKIVENEAVQSSENYFPDKLYELVTLDVTARLDGFMVEEEEEIARKMFLVGFWCIQTTPSDRPSMSKVVEMLEGGLQSIQIPPKPVLFTPTQPGQEFSPSLNAYSEVEDYTES